uniref:Uncharacterized protein n=1 Tax=Cucumis melo TaxID=3656 RepID=A0A9I9EM19_CUCME
MTSSTKNSPFLCTIFLILLLSSIISPSNSQSTNKLHYSNSLFFPSLPKAPTPPSSPSNKGHATLTDLKLLHRTNRRLIADHSSQSPHYYIYCNRFLRSVPSPGVGH